MSTRHSPYHHLDMSQLSPLPAEPRCDVGDAHPHSPGKKTFHLKLKLKSGSTFTVLIRTGAWVTLIVSLGEGAR